ncbi:MAG: DUF2971 domain-containing protein, partial [Alteromonadaceae bacterium]|nr:DUF2971 domain-containing protein [Alteromonadaceae bacterium]
MKPVFKYRGADCSTIKRDLKSLSKNEIFAAAFSSLNDPFEAVIKIDEKSFEVGNLMSNWVPDENKGERLESCSSLKKAAYDFFHFAKNTGIYSLSKTATDELLWAHYASSHKGFCLEFDLDKLLDYKLEGEEVLDVAYTNTPPVISVADLLVSSTDKSKLLQNLTATKSIRWRYESEIRICVGKPGLREYDFRALKAVYFGVRCESKLIRLTMKLLRGRGVKYFKMSLKENSYELTAVEIEDEFLCPVEYRARLASVE